MSKEEMRNSLKSAQKAKKVVNDEFYTPINVIDEELKHYQEELKNSDIICPCDFDILDDDIFALTVTNINGTFDYKINLFAGVTEEEANRILDKREKCNFFIYLRDNMLKYGIKSITISGYEPTTDTGMSYNDIDYSKYSLCITNPPFSKYKSFLNKMIDIKKNNTNFNFILIAPFLNRVCPNIGQHLMLRECYLGYGRKQRIIFNQPGNIPYNKGTAIDWITSFDKAQLSVNKVYMYHGIKYENHKDEYPVMYGMTMKDGTHPIKIDNQNNVPDDYKGWMFCSVGILDILSYDEFEWYGTNFKSYFNKINKEVNPFTHKLSNDMLSMGQDKKSSFHGIVFRRK